MIIGIFGLITIGIAMAFLMTAAVAAAIIALVYFLDKAIDCVSGYYKTLKIFYREKSGKIRPAVLVIQGRDQKKLHFKLIKDNNRYDPDDRKFREFKEAFENAEKNNSYIEDKNGQYTTVYIDEEDERNAKKFNNNNNFN